MNLIHQMDRNEHCNNIRVVHLGRTTLFQYLCNETPPLWLSIRQNIQWKPIIIC